MTAPLAPVYRRRLVATYREILADPKRWDQRVWAERTECGTVGCYAGKAVAAAGWTLVFEDGPEAVAAWAVDPLRGYRALIPKIAREYLGLSTAEADALFHPENTLHDLRELIFDLTGVDPETADLAEAVTV